LYNDEAFELRRQRNASAKGAAAALAEAGVTVTIARRLSPG
jgi:hypothetical protein